MEVQIGIRFTIYNNNGNCVFYAFSETSVASLFLHWIYNNVHCTYRSAYDHYLSFAMGSLRRVWGGGFKLRIYIGQYSKIFQYPKKWRLVPQLLNLDMFYFIMQKLKKNWSCSCEFSPPTCVWTSSMVND